MQLAQDEAPGGILGRFGYMNPEPALAGGTSECVPPLPERRLIETPAPSVSRWAILSRPASGTRIQVIRAAGSRPSKTQQTRTSKLPRQQTQLDGHATRSYLICNRGAVTPHRRTEHSRGRRHCVAADLACNSIVPICSSASGLKALAASACSASVLDLPAGTRPVVASIVTVKPDVFPAPMS